jgi:thiamine kinase-like enzyme
LYAEDPNAVGRQVELYRYLREKHITAPLITWHDHSKAFYQTDVFIQDYTEGVAQDDCLEKHPDEMKSILKSIFTHLTKIHTLPTSEVRTFWISPIAKEFRGWKPFMIYNINFTLHHLTELSLSAEAQERITQALTALKKYTRAQLFDLVPIHGDLSPENIIVHHNNNSCTFARIIDFEWARLGDRLWDYAYYWGWLERLHKPTAVRWYNILQKQCTADELGIIEQYRILFHAWTVRDMLEYKNDSLRLARGEKSREILS